MIGITTVNGYPMPMRERFRRYRAAGFGSVLLWWGPDEAEPRGERIRLAEEHGLLVENVHAMMDNLNALWMEGSAANPVMAELRREIEDCGQYGVGTMVLHLTNGSQPPPVSALGMERIGQLVALAEACRVRLAWENVRLPQHLRRVLDEYCLPHVGLCYDTGHAHYWTRDTDWLSRYGDRVFAVHLHDNRGDRDAHLIPFQGTIDWHAEARAIAASAYRGSITVEAEHRGVVEELDAFLRDAHAGGERLERMIRSI